MLQDDNCRVHKVKSLCRIDDKRDGQIGQTCTISFLLFHTETLKTGSLKTEQRLGASLPDRTGVMNVKGGVGEN